MKTFILTLLCTFIITSMNAQSWQTIFYDDFNRADGAIGNNYNTNMQANITSLGIVGYEVKIASDTFPAYWRVSYVNSIIDDSIRISCKFRSPNLGYGFSINARDNGVNTYSAGIMSNTDTIAIYRRDYIGNSTKLSGEKAYLDINKTYYLEFTLRSADLTFKFVEVGVTDTITINATDNLLTGDNVNLSSYYYTSNLAVYFDDFRIESYSNSSGIDNIEINSYSVFPNPASEIVTLNTGNLNYTDLSVRIYNIVGKLVLSETLQQNQQQINIGDLYNGIYIIEIKSKEWTGKQKLIIHR